MLTYFPTPYPDEWWYSVLCRYHVWSGRSKTATTLSEPYGSRPMVHGRLFPGVDCHAVMKQMPANTINLENVLLGYTLMPYYLRFYPATKKKLVFSSLLNGKSGGITSIQLQTPEGKQGLKFCLQCYTGDLETYGEPYWHREHQIPLMSICLKHSCHLRLVEIPLARLSELFLPLCMIENKIGAETSDSPAWERPLAEALFSVLTMPGVPPTGRKNW